MCQLVVALGEALFFSTTKEGWWLAAGSEQWPTRKLLGTKCNGAWWFLEWVISCYGKDTGSISRLQGSAGWDS